MEIISISKNKHRSIYCFQKKQEFWKLARQFLFKAGVVEGYTEEFGYDDYEKNIETNIKKFKDAKYINEFGNEDVSIDFIFGENKVFIIISYSGDLQMKFSKLIYSIFK